MIQRQSAEIVFGGAVHTQMRCRGYDHCMAYLGGQRVWERLYAEELLRCTRTYKSTASDAYYGSGIKANRVGVRLMMYLYDPADRAKVTIDRCGIASGDPYRRVLQGRPTGIPTYSTTQYNAPAMSCLFHMTNKVRSAWAPPHFVLDLVLMNGEQTVFSLSRAFEPYVITDGENPGFYPGQARAFPSTKYTMYPWYSCQMDYGRGANDRLYSRMVTATGPDEDGYLYSCWDGQPEYAYETDLCVLSRTAYTGYGAASVEVKSDVIRDLRLFEAELGATKATGTQRWLEQQELLTQYVGYSEEDDIQV